MAVRHLIGLPARPGQWRHRATGLQFSISSASSIEVVQQLLMFRADFSRGAQMIQLGAFGTQRRQTETRRSGFSSVWSFRHRFAHRRRRKL